MTAHIDVFPTLAEIVSIPLSETLSNQIEGRSLLPLLKNPQAPWPDRFLVTHVGRWPNGDRVEAWKYRGASIRDSRFTLVENKELYDLQADPGESKNVIDDNPDEAKKLRAAYEPWWESVLPVLNTENTSGPKTSPFAELYRQQVGK